MPKTGVVKEARFMDHHMGAHHPESPQRLMVIYDMLEESDMQGQFIEIPVKSAEKDDILLIHSSDYVDKIASTSGQEYIYLDPDTQTSSGSYDASLLAVGGLCEAITMVRSGELDNAFALVRPPGHHAERTRAMGFCLFNNVAIGARFAQEKLGLGRILVVDWDLHHGNGTQHSFEDDPSILYFSTHQYPYYPGTGNHNETGIGKGEGFTINVPLSTGYGDGEFIGIFERILRPVTVEFDPDLILVSAGFDIYDGDPLGGMDVTPKGFGLLTRSIMEMANACCGGKVVLTLEGGYSLQGLKDSVKEVLKEMAGLSRGHTTDFMEPVHLQMLESITNRVTDIHRRYWKSL